MNLILAERMALDAMAAHNLKDWSIVFNNSATYFGECFNERKIIKLSIPYLLLNDSAAIRDTILHEIAHALTDGCPHNRKWRIVAAKIGAMPCATIDERTTVIPIKRRAKNGIIDYKQARLLLDGGFISYQDFNEIMTKRYL